jgi:hypothetical protein
MWISVKWLNSFAFGLFVQPSRRSEDFGVCQNWSECSVKTSFPDLPGLTALQQLDFH